jgi:hypothetical protein
MERALSGEVLKSVWPRALKAEGIGENVGGKVRKKIGLVKSHRKSLMKYYCFTRPARDKLEG